MMFQDTDKHQVMFSELLCEMWTIISGRLESDCEKSCSVHFQF